MIRCDVLVIGGGLAALRAAIAAREQGASVIVATKGKAGMGGSSVISDGVHAAIFSVGDAPEIFAEDILRGGKGINSESLVHILAQECTERINELSDKFQLDIYREKEVSTPGHRFPRRVYAERGVGKGVTQKFREYAESVGVIFFDQTWILDLLSEQGRIIGALAVRLTETLVFQAGNVILATGGVGGLYANSDNPKDVSGEALGMAWRHGVDLQDMEFIQYYPYRLIEPANIDLYTKLFGKGAKMRNGAGERFMEHFPKKEMETRDVLCYEMYKQKDVYLDLSDVPANVIDEVSPRLAQLLRKGYEGSLRMAPVEHYSMGGIMTDTYGRTNIAGLYACGECTGGVHGANRLGGGSLTETLVFGTRSGITAAEESMIKPVISAIAVNGQKVMEEIQSRAAVLRKQIQQWMWDEVGIYRTLAGMQLVQNRLQEQIRLLTEDRSLSIVANQVLMDMVHAARLIVCSALERKESRGAHQRADFPNEDPKWRGNVRIHQERIWFEPKEES